MTTLAERYSSDLEARIRAKRLSIADVARRASTDRASLSMFLNHPDERNVTLEWLDRIYAALRAAPLRPPKRRRNRRHERNRKGPR